ncbi:hypothetical protein BDR26DRAFT_857110 [Obelidium mucronatum]|nr:hypothetical protein BDR26DRAFT_857110 [Obelidium mucronatum]
MSFVTQSRGSGGIVNSPSSGAVFPGVSQGSIFGIGEPNAISWTNTVSPSTDSISSLDIWLGTGTKNQVKSLYSVGNVSYPTTNCFLWIPRSNLSVDKNYTLVFHGLNSKNTIVTLDYVTWFSLSEPGSMNYPKETSCISTDVSDDSPIRALQSAADPVDDLAPMKQFSTAGNAVIQSVQSDEKQAEVNEATLAKAFFLFLSLNLLLSL